MSWGGSVPKLCVSFIEISSEPVSHLEMLMTTQFKDLWNAMSTPKLSHSATQE